MTLKLRFSLSFMVNTLMVVVLFGGTYYVLEKRAAIEAQSREQRQTLEKVAAVCRTMVLSSNGLVAVNYFNALKKEPEIVSAACIDPKGRIQVHSDSKLTGIMIADSDDLRMLADPSIRSHHHRTPEGIGTIEWTLPVSFSADRISVAQVRYNEDVLNRAMQENLLATLKKLLAVSAGTVFFAGLFGLALAWSLSLPISKLEETARSIGEGNLDAQTPIVNRKDELGRLAKEMNSMAGKLKALDELKDQLISQVSHDLRNPMAAIRMYAEFMLNLDEERDKILPRHRDMLAIMQDNATRLNVFVSNILDAAKIKAGRMQYHMEPVDLNAVASGVVALYRILAEQGTIALKTNIPPDAAAVMADRERLEQILANLVANAMKFTRPGGTVAITAQKRNGAVGIQVTDNGQGISPDQLSRLFQPFSQADVARQRAEGIHGTGLGLYIVKQTVEAMNGRVAIASELGKGTRVEIILPPGGSHA